MGRLRIQRGLRRTVPSLADTPLKAGDKVVVWKEKVIDSRIG